MRLLNAILDVALSVTALLITAAAVAVGSVSATLIFCAYAVEGARSK